MTERRFPAALLPAAAGLLVLCLASCGRTAPKPLGHRGYVWQRNWTPAVAGAVRTTPDILCGLVVLGAEVHWNRDKPDILRTNIIWDALRSLPISVSLAVRVAPYQGPFRPDDPQALAVREAMAGLIHDAKAHRITVNEVQLDFDCAQDKLSGYRTWLHALRPACQGIPLVITALPAWLKENDLPALLDETDGYVLQVHSVPTRKESGRSSLCDPALARRWADAASKLERPFFISLPTYWCLAGYSPEGQLRGVAMDSVQPAWPADTRVMEFRPQADEVAGLVREWNAHPPRGLAGFLWYRLPVPGDKRNWHAKTFSAVAAGRAPRRGLAAQATASNPTDIFLVNSGESDDDEPGPVVVEWENASLTAFDSLPGWSAQAAPGRLTFSPLPGFRLHLAPGERRVIGWLRFDHETIVRTRNHAAHEKDP